MATKKDGEKQTSKNTEVEIDRTLGDRALSLAAAVFEIDTSTVLKKYGHTQAKNLAIYLMREVAKKPVPYVMKIIGAKAPATVTAGVKKAKEMVAKDSDFADKAERLSQELCPDRVKKEKKTAPKKEKVLSQEVLTNTIMDAVAEVFLGKKLLQSENPKNDISFAKDLYIFILWIEFDEILDSLKIPKDEIHRAVGRICDDNKHDDSLEEKIKEVLSVHDQMVKTAHS